MLATTLAVIEAITFQAGQDAGLSSPPLVLPRSSIAAVLARRGELNLAAAQVKDLERRDEELQREQQDIRERFNVPAETPQTKSPLAFKGPGGGGGRSQSGPPGTAPGDTSGGGPGNPGGGSGGAAGGRGGHGQGTQGSRGKSDDPKQRAARLLEELDGADTRAWMEAAAKLPPELQERATAIAEKYREDLSDQRERPGK
jgi:hypothetical protein